MRKMRRRANRWLAVAAALFVALGSALVTAGVASGETPIGHYASIRFWNNYDVVTMRVPLPMYCPAGQPQCVWELYVDEPDIPTQPAVGYCLRKAGSPVVLEVNYPKNFCGVIQADAIVGPNPWFFRFGHIDMIHTCDSPPTTNPPTTTPPTTNPPTTNPPTTSPPTTGYTSPNDEPTDTDHRSRGSYRRLAALPFTGATTTTVDSSFDSTTAPTVAASSGTLPFTGLSIPPLLFIGIALIVLGLAILSTLEQRRRALRRVGAVMAASAQYSSRTSHWFLGD